MKIASQGIKIQYSITKLNFNINEFYSIYYIKRIADDKNLKKTLKLEDKEHSLFESFFTDIIDDILENFYENVKDLPLQGEIIKQIDSLIKELKNKYRHFENDLNDDFSDPFTGEKYWNNKDNELWRFYGFVHLSILQSIPLALKVLKTRIKSLDIKQPKNLSHETIKLEPEKEKFTLTFKGDKGIIPTIFYRLFKSGLIDTSVANLIRFLLENFKDEKGGGYKESTLVDIFNDSKQHTKSKKVNLIIEPSIKRP